MHLFRMVLGRKCHHQFRVISGYIKDVKMMNFKSLAKQEDE